MKLTLIIPAHNEEGRIGKTLYSYLTFFDKLQKQKKLSYLLFVSINATSDNTEKVVKKYQKKHSSLKYKAYQEGGKGFAIVQGFKDAIKSRSDFIGFVDADLATSPEAFYALCQNIGKNDGIIGSRWLSSSIIQHRQTRLRQLASRIFNFLVRILFSMQYEDTQCGAKLFSRKAIEKIVDRIYITQWAFDVNLLYLCKLYNLKVREHPTIWSDIEGSKVNVMKTSLKMFFGILRLRIFYSPFRSIIKVYNSLPEWIKVNHHLVS